MNKLDGTRMTVKIKEVFVRVLDLGLDHRQLADDISLYSPVVQMDSMTLLHLLVALEEEFDIEIDDEDVMNANLTNVGSLVAMVRRAIDASVGGTGPASA